MARIQGLMVRAFSAVAALSIAAGAQAAIFTFTTTMDGPSESPPVASPGTGTATVTIDTVANTMRVQASWQNLVGTTTVAHIHAPTAVAFAGTVGVATYPSTFPGWPVGVTAGSYDMTFDTSLTSTYTAAFLTLAGGTPELAEAALIGFLGNGRAYFNVHSTFAPGGEIRGFLVPAPGAVALAGLAGLAATRRRR